METPLKMVLVTVAFIVLFHSCAVTGMHLPEDLNQCCKDDLRDQDGFNPGNCTFERLSKLSWAKDPTCNNSKDMSDEVDACLSKWMVDGKQSDAANISLAFSAEIFDVCALSNRLMHEAFVKHTCARSKSKLAVKAIMNAVQQPENVTEENLKHMPVAMFALFKLAKIHQWYDTEKQQNDTRASDLFRQKICNSVKAQDTDVEPEITRRLIIMGDCLNFMPAAFSEANSRIRALAFDAIKHFNKDRKWDDNDWKIALETGCDNIDVAELDRIENAPMRFMQNKDGFQKCLIQWVKDEMYDKRNALYRAIENSTDFSNMSISEVKQFCSMIIFAPLKILKQLNENKIRQGIFDIFEECLPNPIVMQIPRENLLHILRAQPEEYYDWELINQPNQDKAIKYLRIAILGDPTYKSLKKPNATMRIRNIIGNVSDRASSPWSEYEAKQLIHLAGFNDDTWKRVTARSVLNYKIFVCILDKRTVDLFPQEVFTEEVVREMLKFLAKCEIQKDMGKTILDRASSLSIDYSSLTCHNLTKRYAAFVKADPIKWMKNVPENVTAECSELFMQAVAESGLTNDKIEQVIKAIRPNLLEILSKACDEKSFASKIVPYIPENLLPKDTNNDTCEKVKKWSNTFCGVGRWTSYLSRIAKQCMPELDQVRVCSPNYTCGMAARMGRLICNISPHDIPRAQRLMNEGCWDDVFRQVVSQCSVSDMDDDQAQAWGMYIFIHRNRTSFRKILKEVTGRQIGYFLMKLPFNRLDDMTRDEMPETIGRWMKEIPIEFWLNLPRPTIQRVMRMVVNKMTSDGKKLDMERLQMLGRLICYVDMELIESKFPAEIPMGSIILFNNCPLLPFSILEKLKSRMNFNALQGEVSAKDMCELAPLLFTMTQSWDQLNLLKPERLCPIFKTCVVPALFHPWELQKKVENMGMEHPTDNIMRYLTAGRILALKCLYKSDDKWLMPNEVRKGDSKPTCTGIRDVGEKAVIAISAVEIDDLSYEDFLDCVDIITRAQYLDTQTDVKLAIIQRMKEGDSDLSRWKQNLVGKFGTLVTAFSDDELRTLPLDKDILAKWSQMDVQWTADQLKAGLKVMLADGAPLSGKDIVSAGKFACGLTTDQIAAVNAEEYKSVKDWIGMLNCWNSGQQAAWFNKFTSLYGSALNQWTEELTSAVGTILGGASEQILSSFDEQQMQMLKPGVLARIPPGKFSRFSEEQLRNLSANQANRITKEQFDSLNAAKKEIVKNLIARRPQFLRENIELKNINLCDESDIAGIDFGNCDIKDSKTRQFAADKTCTSSRDISDEMKTCISPWEIDGQNAGAANISQAFTSGAMDVCSFQDNRLMHVMFGKMVCAYLRDAGAIMNVFELYVRPHDITEDNLRSVPCVMFAFFNVSNFHSVFKVHKDYASVFNIIRKKICVDVINWCTSELTIIKKLIALGECFDWNYRDDLLDQAGPDMKQAFASALQVSRGSASNWGSAEWKAALQLSETCDNIDHQTLRSLANLDIVSDNQAAFHKCLKVWYDTSQRDLVNAFYEGVKKHVQFSSLTRNNTRDYCGLLIYAPFNGFFKAIPIASLDGIFEVFEQCITDPQNIPRPNLIHLLESKDVAFYRQLPPDIFTRYLRVALYSNKLFNMLKSNVMKPVVEEAVVNISRSASVPWTKPEARKIIDIVQYADSTWQNVTNTSILDYKILSCALDHRVLKLMPEDALPKTVLEELILLIQHCDEVNDKLVEGLANRLAANPDIDFSIVSCNDLRDKYSAILRSSPEIVMREITVEVTVDCIDQLVLQIVASRLNNRIADLISKIWSKVPGIVRDGCSGKKDIGELIPLFPQKLLPPVNNETCAALEMDTWPSITCKTGRWTKFMAKLWKFCRPDVGKICGPSYKLETAAKSGELICGISPKEIPQANVTNKDCWDEVFMAVSKECAALKVMNEAQEKAWGAYMVARINDQDFVTRIKSLTEGNFGRIISRLPADKRDAIKNAVGADVVGKWLSSVPSKFWSLLPRSAIQGLVSQVIKALIGNEPKMNQQNVLDLETLICYVNASHFALFPGDFTLAVARFKECPKLDFTLLRAIKEKLNITFDQIDSGAICSMGPVLRAVSAEEAAEIDSDVICPVYKECIGDVIDKQKQLSRDRRIAGVEENSENSNYTSSDRELAGRCLYQVASSRRKREVVIKKPTCNGITLAGDSSVVNINGEEFKAMDAADFQQCLDPIVKGQYTQEQTDTMHAIITRLQSELYGSNFINWPDNEVPDFGTIASNLTATHIKAFKALNKDTLSKWSDLDATWEMEQLKAGLETVFGSNKDGADFTANDLMSIGKFACGLTTTQINAVNVSVYDNAKDSLGSQTCWNTEQKTAWFNHYQSIYGNDSSTWDEETLSALGTALGGAPTETLSQLSSEQMQNLEADVVANIPPESFNAFSTEQLGQLSSTQSNLITVDQINALDKSKQTVVEDKITKETDTTAAPQLTTESTADTPEVTTADPNEGLGNNGAGNVKVSAVLSAVLVVMVLLI